MISGVIASGAAYVAAVAAGNPIVQATAVLGSASDIVIPFDATPNTGDVILVQWSPRTTSSGTVHSIKSAGYTQINSQFSADVNSVRSVTAMKVSDGTETSVTVSATITTTFGGVALIAIVPNINGTTQLDVAVVATAAGNSYIPNPGAITPVTSGAKIIVFGAGTLQTTPFTSSDLTGFVSDVSGASSPVVGGIGYHDWTSGAFDAAAFGAGADSTNAAWTALAVALRPAAAAAGVQNGEGLTEVTEATGSAWTELASLDLTDLVTDETYLVFYSLEVSCTSTGTCSHQLMDDAVTVVGHVQKMKEPSGPTDYIGLVGMYSFVATGPTKTVALRIQRGSGAGTASAKNGRLTSIILGDDDVISTSAAATSTTSGTYATKTSITFTPPTTGDYLILAMGNLQGIGGSRPHFRINDGSTTWSYGTQFNDVAAGDYYPALFLSEQLALSGSKTFDLEFASIATGDLCSIKDAVLVALRLDRFANSYITALGTADSANVATYTDTALTQTFTPAAGSHLTICGFGMSGNSSSTTGYLKYVDGADDVMESIREHTTTAATIIGPGGCHRVADYTASSRTQKVQRNAESTNIVTVSENSIIATLDLTGI